MRDESLPAVSLTDLAVGLAAGVAGTAAMSTSQAIEMRITGRKPSTSPAEAICVMLGVETRSDDQETRLATEMHWVYGAALGVGQLVVRKLPEPQRSLSYIAAIWSIGAAVVTGTGVSPPPTKWGAKAIAIDIMHHTVYAGVAGLVARMLSQRGASTNAKRSDRPAE